MKETYPDDLMNEKRITSHGFFSHIKVLKEGTTIQKYHGAGTALEKHLLRDIAGFREGIRVCSAFKPATKVYKKCNLCNFLHSESTKMQLQI